MRKNFCDNWRSFFDTIKLRQQKKTAKSLRKYQEYFFIKPIMVYGHINDNITKNYSDNKSNIPVLKP